MLFETQNLSDLSKCGTDFSIAAIMAKGLTDKKACERNLTQFEPASEVNDGPIIDINVDIEECSDIEEISSTFYCSSESRQTVKPETSSDDEQTSSVPVIIRQKIVGSCNSDDLKPIQCHLETKELWDKFDDLGTEMIITKSGRRMFPTLRVSFSGPLRQSHPTDRYVVLLDIVPFDSRRYRYAYHRSSWLVAGKADPPPIPKLYAHPDTPLGPDVLRRQVISFEKVKLTNDAKEGKKELIVLNSMHRYQPRIHLARLTPEQNIPTTPHELKELHHKTFVFPETVFTAVTAYQNQLITKLKIDSNPFAKGFRDSSRLTDFDFERDPREVMMREHQLRSSFGLLTDPVMAQFMQHNPECTSAAFLERARQNLQILQRFPFTELLLPQFYQSTNATSINFNLRHGQWPPQVPVRFPILQSTHHTTPNPISRGAVSPTTEIKTKMFQRFHPYSMQVQQIPNPNSSTS